MNLIGVNIAIVSTVTSPSVIQKSGFTAKTTNTTMFQHPGNPAKDLSQP